MRILFIGDISGEPGRKTIKEVVPTLRQKQKIDLVIANCENAAGGRGVTKQVVDELQSYGIDFFTTGEHVWGIKSFQDDLQDPNLPLVRPYNYEKQSQIPGTGYKMLELGKEKVVVIAMVGQTFMRENVRNPFWMLASLLNKKKEDWQSATILVDFHAEATSEKVSLVYNFRDQVTAILGTHTHVATADPRLFNNTGFVTDVGMVGPYDASLWVNFEDVIHNFKYPFKKAFTMQTEGRRIFNAVLLETSNELTDFGVKKCTSIVRIDQILD
jgi:2',3'-cyclic-nucleotide 2'-phosphodiesterase